MEEKQPWIVKTHSYQIADTGDYDGHYEITNGKFSLLTSDDDYGDESEDHPFEALAAALNKTQAKFWTDKDDQVCELQMETGYYKDELNRCAERCEQLEKEVEMLKQENKRISGIILDAFYNNYDTNSLDCNALDVEWYEFKKKHNL